MTVNIIKGDQLTLSQIQTWKQIQQSNKHLNSPYFSPEYISLVTEVQKNIYIGVLSTAQETIGFFPFMRRGERGFPISSRISDFHGLIIRPETPWNPQELLAACELTSWKFNHLVPEQLPLYPYCSQYIPSPFMDLSKGYQAYRADRCKSGTRKIKKTEGLYRKLEREEGKLRFVPYESCQTLLNQLMIWKVRQYLSTDSPNIFAIPWIMEFIKKLHTTNTSNLRGALSVLYLNDQPIAIHMGMHSEKVWHYWFPAYDPKWRKFSPGILLLLEIAKYAASHGFAKIDLGIGKQLYKDQLASNTIDLAVGEVTVPHPSFQ